MMSRELNDALWYTLAQCFISQLNDTKSLKASRRSYAMLRDLSSFNDND